MNKQRQKFKNTLLFIFITSSLLAVLSVIIHAASYPSMYPKQYEYTVTQGETLEMVFTIFHEFKNEKSHVKIHKDDRYGNIVASADRDFYNYSNPMTEYTLTWDTTDIEVGEYVVEYWMSFYSIYSWHEEPNHKFLLKINILAPACTNGCKYDNGTITKNATCTEEGVKTFTCKICNHTKEEKISIAEHKYDKGVIVKNATCTYEGKKTYTCSTCNKTKNEAVPKTEHIWNDGITTVQPTVFSEGLKTFTCNVCKSTYDKPILPIFTDVSKDAYYANAVEWAYNSQITNGVGNNNFAPNETCTRGQVVTFLWRANGSPEPKIKANSFKDVNENDYFYKAILWAVEKGITNGTNSDSTEFSPHLMCSNAHIITFIWRSLGQPNHTGTGEWYEDSINWANDNELLTDTSANADITRACPRSDVVTFLYKSIKENN